MKSHLSIGFINLNVSSKFPPKGENLFIFNSGCFLKRRKRQICKFFLF